MSGVLYRWGRLAARRRWLVVAAWVLALPLLLGAGRNMGGEFSEEFGIPGSESAATQDFLEARFAEVSGGSARIVFSAGSASLDDPGARSAVEATLASVTELDDIAIVGDPYSGLGGAVSADRRVAFADVRYDAPLDELGAETLDELDETVQIGRDMGVQVELGGELPAYYQAPELGGPEMALKLAAALVIMLVAFGSVLATALPLALALVGLAAGIGGVLLLASVLEVPSSSLLLGVMLGLGVGIDYALFIVTRHRQQLAQGMDVSESIGHAMATAGQAVVFAGLTVVISIGGLVVAGIPAATTMGASAALVVSAMVVAALTLLPALLGFVGEGIDRLRLPGHKVELGSATTGFWARWAHHVAARPWRYLLASTAVLLVLALPLLSMRMAMPDASTASADSTRRKAHELLSEAFGPGFSTPLVVAVDLSGVDDESTAALGELRSAIEADPQVAQVSMAMPNAAGDAAVIQVTSRSSSSDNATEDLVHRLRGEALEEALAATGAEVSVGGITAIHVDLTDQAGDRLPYFIATIVALSIALLMMAFRSVWVPLKAAAMNMLSIGAGYGAVVAVFQWGWLGGVFALDHPVPVVSLVPMVMFAVLFGLSMDYEVFLLSRTREEYQRTRDNTASIVAGISNTARVITSAALIMIVVFTGFALGENVIIKQIGLGLAVAVAVDATIVRIALVPSTMVLLGDRNWTMPRWLDRLLPHIELEAESGTQ